MKVAEEKCIETFKANFLFLLFKIQSELQEIAAA